MKKKVILLPIVFCIFMMYTLICSKVNAYDITYELMSNYIGFGSNSNVFSVGEKNINPEVLFNFVKVYYDGNDCVDVKLQEIDHSKLEIVSSDPNIIEINKDEDGNLELNALSEGIAYLDINYTFNDKKYDCISTFTNEKERIPCYVCNFDDEIEGGSKVLLSKSNVEIEKDKTENVEVKQMEFGSAVTNATYQCNYVWSSKDSNIATVDGNSECYEKNGLVFTYGSVGTIKAISEGETEIYCKVTSKDKKEEVIKVITVKVFENKEEQEANEPNAEEDKENKEEWVNPFWDVNEKNWFYNAVKFVNQNGIILGYNKTTFAPNDKLTRAMIVTILYRMENPTTKYDGVKFDDVEAGKWYTEPVMWAYQNGIVHGYDGTNNFGPNDNIKRQDLAVILRNYAKFKGKDVEVTSGIEKFSDCSEISDYANKAMQWAVGKGVITGNDNGTLAPKDNATRAEAAAMIQKYCKNINSVE